MKTPQPANQRKKENARKGKKWYLALPAVALLVAAVFVTLHFSGVKLPWSKNPDSIKMIEAGEVFPGVSKRAVDGHLSSLTADEIKKHEETPVNENSVTYLLNRYPVFKNGKAKGDFAIANPCYSGLPVVIQIFLKDTNEIVYDSGGLKPNQYIYEDNLLKRLKAGTYEATAFINAYDPETNVWCAKAQESLIITVQN